MRKRIIISFILIALLSFSSALAAGSSSGGGGGGWGGSTSGSGGSVGKLDSIDVSVDYTNHTVTISGDTDAAYKFRNVTLHVMNDGSKIKDFDVEGALNWYDQGKTDKNGSYSFSYKIDGETDTYAVYIGIDGYEKTLRTYFDYYSPEDADDLLDEIKAYIKAKDADGIGGIIGDYSIMLQLDILAYDDLSYENQHLVCEGIIKLAPDTLNEFSDCFEDALKVQQVNTSADDEAYLKALKELAGEENAAAGDLLDSLKPAEKEKIVNDLMETDYITTEDMVGDYVSKVLLAKVNSIDVWGEMEAFLKDAGDILGIDFADYNKLGDKSKAIKEMLGITYEDTADIKKAFDDAVEDVLDAENSKPSGTTGGGGGGGGGGYKTAPSTITPLPDVNSIAQSEVFSDLTEAEWARESILSLCDKGIISGYSNKTFRPNNNVTRAEFLKMTVMLFGIKAADGAENKFEDVKKTDWHYDYVYAALSNGIVDGVSETAFNPDGLITRQDMAVILYRAATFAGKTYADGEIFFADKDSISNYAADAVSAFSKAGIINGYNNMFNPTNTATRAEAAQILYNILNGGI